MKVFQDITFVPVVGVLKLFPCIEHAAMESSEPKKTKTNEKNAKYSSDFNEVTLFLIRCYHFANYISII